MNELWCLVDSMATNREEAAVVCGYKTKAQIHFGAASIKVNELYQ